MAIEVYFSLSSDPLSTTLSLPPSLFLPLFLSFSLPSHPLVVPLSHSHPPSFSQGLALTSFFPGQVIALTSVLLPLPHSSSLEPGSLWLPLQTISPLLDHRSVHPIYNTLITHTHITHSLITLTHHKHTSLITHTHVITCTRHSHKNTSSHTHTHIITHTSLITHTSSHTHITHHTHVITHFTHHTHITHHTHTSSHTSLITHTRHHTLHSSHTHTLHSSHTHTSLVTHTHTVPGGR